MITHHSILNATGTIIHNPNDSLATHYNHGLLNDSPNVITDSLDNLTEGRPSLEGTNLSRKELQYQNQSNSQVNAFYVQDQETSQLSLKMKPIF